MKFPNRFLQTGAALIVSSLSGFAANETAPIAKFLAPHQYNPFGTPGDTSPELLAALNKMSETGIFEGRRNSLHLFRWSGTPPKLTHLGLWGAKVNNELMSLTALMPDLAFVSLYETSVDDSGVETLLKLPNLRYLTFAPIERYEKAGFGAPQWSYPTIERNHERPRVTGKILKAFAQSKTLESIDLSDTKVESKDLEALAGCPKLGSVGLPNIIDEETVKHLRACKRLSNLSIGNREVGAEEIERLAAWKGLRSLTIIRAHLSKETLLALSKLETVEALHLVDCGLSDESLQYLKGSPKLALLDLTRNEINGPGLVHVSKLNLKGLELTFNNLNDLTIKHLPQLGGLETLNISYNTGITNAGIQNGTLQGMTQLKKLELRGLKKVTDASYEDLVKLGFLTNLGIRETTTSVETVARLKAAMPKTDVFK
jgi:hypothetical protein